MIQSLHVIWCWFVFWGLAFWWRHVHLYLYLRVCFSFGCSSGIPVLVLQPRIRICVIIMRVRCALYVPASFALFFYCFVFFAFHMCVSITQWRGRIYTPSGGGRGWRVTAHRKKQRQYISNPCKRDRTKFVAFLQNTANIKYTAFSRRRGSQGAH